MKRCNLGIMLLLLIVALFTGCAQTPTHAPTTGGSVDSSNRETDVKIDNAGNTGSINQYFNMDKETGYESTSKDVAGAQVKGTSSTDTPVDLALSQAKNGGTLQLAEEGAELFMEGIESVFTAFRKNSETNNTGTTPSTGDDVDTGAGADTGIVEPIEPVPDPDEIVTKEPLRYSGRTNGDRPTWYAKHNMSVYPAGSVISYDGCGTLVLKTNNGTRYESNGYLVKQSDVAGRGLATLAPSSCKSQVATITYGK